MSEYETDSFGAERTWGWRHKLVYDPTWMRTGKGIVWSEGHGGFVLYYNGVEADASDATMVFLKGTTGVTKNLLVDGSGKVIGFAVPDPDMDPLEWSPHFHARKVPRFSPDFRVNIQTPQWASSGNQIRPDLLTLPPPVMYGEWRESSQGGSFGVRATQCVKQTRHNMLRAARPFSRKELDAYTIREWRNPPNARLLYLRTPVKTSGGRRGFSVIAPTMEWACRVGKSLLRTNPALRGWIMVTGEPRYLQNAHTWRATAGWQPGPEKGPARWHSYTIWREVAHEASDIYSAPRGAAPVRRGDKPPRRRPGHH